MDRLEQTTVRGRGRPQAWCEANAIIAPVKLITLTVAAFMTCGGGCASPEPPAVTTAHYQYPDPKDDWDARQLFEMSNDVLKWNVQLRDQVDRITQRFPSTCGLRIETAAVGWSRYSVEEALIDQEGVGWLIFTIWSPVGTEQVLGVRQLRDADTRELRRLVEGFVPSCGKVRSSELFLPPDPPVYYLTVSTPSRRLELVLHPALLGGDLDAVEDDGVKEGARDLRAMVNWVWHRTPMYDIREPPSHFEETEATMIQVPGPQAAG